MPVVNIFSKKEDLKLLLPKMDGVYIAAGHMILIC